MRQAFAVASAVLLSLTGLPAEVALAQYTLGPAPSWVTPLAVDVAARAAAGADGALAYLLVDDQVRVDGSDQVVFSRLVKKVLNQEGISEASRVSVTIDPEYERLTLHEVVVHRAGTRRNALVEENVSVLQRETQRERQLYDGRKTVDVILDDLRVGDIVEYSFSIRGANPIFGGRYANGFYTRYSVPLERLRFRLIWPSERGLNVAMRGGAPEPEIRQTGAFTEYVWDLEKLPALLADGDTPDWFEPYPGVQLSEWNSWGEVVEWALPMYTPRPDAVRSMAAEIEASRTSSEDRLLAALRFVQDEVRYLGFEMGTGSHEPRVPVQVVRTRFGDCKDKSLLLVSLLDALRIAAYPVFVHSSRGRGLAEWHPSPFAFDHVIVVAHLDGGRYWLDPTMDHQRGTLDRLYQPDFGLALVLRKGESALTTMDPPRQASPTREIEDTFDLSRKENEPAAYVVRTIYHGADADAMRRHLAGQSRDEVTRIYLNYYAASYPTIEMTDSIKVYDDEELNRLIVDEEYAIPDIWEDSEEEEGTRLVLFSAAETRSLFSRPSTSRRSTPLAVDHPTHVLHTITARLPEPWDIKQVSKEIADDAIEFTSMISYERNVLTMRYEYRSKADHVLPERVPEHLKNVDRILDNIGYEIYRYGDGEEAAGNVNWLLILVGILTIEVCAVLALLVYRYERSTPPLTPEEQDPRYTGLGGWLILVGIGIVLTPFISLFNGIHVLNSAPPETWDLLTDRGSDNYHVLWAPTLVFEMVANSARLVFAVVAGILFFRRRHSFPRVYTFVLAGAAVLSVTDTILAASLPDTGIGAENFVTLMRDVLFSGIWIAYLNVSKRVESTFVYRRGERAMVRSGARVAATSLVNSGPASQLLE